MPSSVYMYSAVLLHTCCSLDLDCVIEVWSQLTPPGGGRGSRRKDFSSLEVCLWTVKWGLSFSFLSLCVCAHVCVWVCTCRGVHTQACVRRPEGNNRCLLQSASTLCLEAGSHWNWSSLTELGWLLSVFWHVDDSASPELHFAGAHHHMWLLQECWGSELGSLCSHANATGLKATGPNDRALKSLNTPRENQTFSLHTDLS